MQMIKSGRSIWNRELNVSIKGTEAMPEFIAARLRQRRLILLFGAAAIAYGFMLSSGIAFGNEWPQWRGPNRDGISVETGWQAQWPDEGPPQLWKKNVG